MKTLCWKLAGLSTCATWRHIYVNQQVTFPRLGLLNDYGLAEGAVLTDFWMSPAGIYMAMRMNVTVAQSPVG